MNERVRLAVEIAMDAVRHLEPAELDEAITEIERRMICTGRGARHAGAVGPRGRTMSDTRFQNAVGYIMGSRDERFISLLCPKCAADRMGAVSSSGDEITYVETVDLVRSARGRCGSCRSFPLVMTARELLTPRRLVGFMGRVLKMAETAERERQRALAVTR